MKKVFYLMIFLCGTVGFANENSLPKTLGEKYESWLNLNVSQWEKATEHFYKKLNTNLFNHLFESEEVMFVWIESNLEFTNFNSVEEAKLHWNLILDLQRQEFYKNSTIKITSPYSYLVHLQIQNLIIEQKISDECGDNFKKYSEAHSEIYANQIEKLYGEYKGKERDERFNKIHLTIEKNDFIRMNNCTSYFRNCIGI